MCPCVRTCECKCACVNTQDGGRAPNLPRGLGLRQGGIRRSYGNTMNMDTAELLPGAVPQVWVVRQEAGEDKGRDGEVAPTHRGLGAGPGPRLRVWWVGPGPITVGRAWAPSPPSSFPAPRPAPCSLRASSQAESPDQQVSSFCRCLWPGPKLPSHSPRPSTRQLLQARATPSPRPTLFRDPHRTYLGLCLRRPPLPAHTRPSLALPHR